MTSSPVLMTMAIAAKVVETRVVRAQEATEPAVAAAEWTVCLLLLLLLL